MPTAPLQARLDADLRRYAAFGDKRSGSPGDLASADWIAKRLSSAGYDVTQPRFSVPSFAARAANLRAGGKQIAVMPQPVVVPTPADGLMRKGRLVRDQYDARGAAGRIAIIILPFDRHASIFRKDVLALIDEVSARDAAAIVIVTTGPTGRIVGLNTKLKPMAAVPIALMAPTDLPLIAEAVANDSDLTLTLDGRNETKQSCNVIARRLAGPKWLAFSTPRSGWGPCVGERGPGTAAFLDLCEWAAKRYPRHSIFALNSGGHELDFAGTHAAAKEGPPPGDTIIWTHLGAGLATRDAVEVVRREPQLTATADAQRVLMVSTTLLQPARQVFRDLVGYNDPIEVVGGVGELSSIIDQGYRNAFAGLGIHRWCHVDTDTIDKVDAGLLVPVVDAHRKLVSLMVDRT